MEGSVLENPFRYGGIVLGPYFADRQEEMEELKKEIRNFSRVFLVSPRRYGKTCLLFTDSFMPYWIDSMI
jgi:hypothetical protein